MRNAYESVRNAHRDNSMRNAYERCGTHTSTNTNNTSQREFPLDNSKNNNVLTRYLEKPRKTKTESV